MKLRLTVEVTITDRKKLLAYARKRYRTCWEEEMESNDAGDLVAEALILSNENPSPADYGININTVTAEVIDEART